MRFVVERLPPRGAVEVVERKGAGHPDTLADAIAEGFSLALSAWYRDRFGRILHHNVDKALLAGGASSPRWGGGTLTSPIDLTLAGRVTSELGGVRVPVEEIAHEAVARVVRARLRYLDPADIRVRVCVHPGSAELEALLGVANDTSIGVGYAPASPLERAVLDADAGFDAARALRPWLGEDTKVMGVRVGDEISLTAAIAFVDRFLGDEADYFARKAELGIVVNAADRPGKVYLTVTGSSIEAGDDGQVGRGNRVGGLITPMRPMTLEATAGKNPVSHVGKLYSVVARRIAEALVAEGAGEAEVVLVSRIGCPIADPWLACARVRETVPRAEELARAALAELPAMTEAIMAEAVALW